VAIYSVPRLLADIRRTFDDGSPMNQTELIDRLGEVDLLHLDDLGAEQSSTWVLEQLYSIVNARYEAEKAIVMTTNLTDPEQLSEQVGARTVSRLEEMCTVIPVGGADLRRQTFGVEPEAAQPTALRWDVA
jgi:DNA replication protein DnaC